MYLVSVVDFQSGEKELCRGLSNEHLVQV
jgi:hypothetical protein